VVREQGLLQGSEPNITILLPHRLGKEYPKTFGHYHLHGEEETYRILYGRAGLLIQKPKSSGHPEIIEDIQLLTAHAGEVFKVPPGYGHCLINLGSGLLITADWEAESAGHNYEPIEKLRGFGYYVVEEDTGPKFILNPNYKLVPEIKMPNLKIQMTSQSQKSNDKN